MNRKPYILVATVLTKVMLNQWEWIVRAAEIVRTIETITNDDMSHDDDISTGLSTH